jgi:hypothetical protein
VLTLDRPTDRGRQTVLVTRRLDWSAFTTGFLPECLSQEGVQATVAQALGVEMTQRADSFAAAGPLARDVLRAPWIEEVTGYEPAAAQVPLLAAVTLIVRNSGLEHLHAGGTGLPTPTLPGLDELIDVARRDDGQVVRDGIEPRFDQAAIQLLTDVVNGDRDLVYATHLSRLSRNTDKLLRTLEIILAAGVPVLTTNMLLRPNDVWIREPDAFITPVSTDPLAGLRDLRGLAGSHRKLVASLHDQLTS